jgi:hypothetical protein
VTGKAGERDGESVDRPPNTPESAPPSSAMRIACLQKHRAPGVPRAWVRRSAGGVRRSIAMLLSLLMERRSLSPLASLRLCARTFFESGLLDEREEGR